jgi:zinc transport system substrate-binding protein
VRYLVKAMRTTVAALALTLGVFSPGAMALSPDSPTDKIGVMVSILPLAYFAEGVGKEMVEVSVMVPPGGNPHTYEPTPLQLGRLSRAKLYVKVGSGIEFELAWMDKLAALNRAMKICDASKGIALIDMEGRCDHDNDQGGAADPHRGKDPHVWLSPANAAVIVKNIRDALAEADPVHAEAYAANARALTAGLEQLDEELRKTLAPVRGGTFIVFHPGWGYFAARYGLTQAPIEIGGKEPTGKELAAVVTRARKLGAKTVFASPEFSRKTAEVIAREIGGRVLLIDSLAKDYPANLRRVAAAIAREAR